MEEKVKQIGKLLSGIKSVKTNIGPSLCRQRISDKICTRKQSFPSKFKSIEHENLVNV